MDKERLGTMVRLARTDLLALIMDSNIRLTRKQWQAIENAEHAMRIVAAELTEE